MALIARAESDGADRKPAPEARDKDQIAAWLALFADPAAVVELRAIGVSRVGTEATHVESTFYDADDAGLRAMARDARKLSGRASGVYFTLNPLGLRPDAVAARDAHVLRRRWFLVDVDPTRPAEASSTEDEKANAFAVAKLIRDYLRHEGWPDPILCDSGNGWHLLYRIDLPNDDGAKQLVHRALKALAANFDGPFARVDTTCHNASRICKVYGTLARKGEATADRPHRVAKVVEVPSPVQVAGVEWLIALASELPEYGPAPPPAPTAPPAPKGLVARSVDPDSPVERARAYLADCQPAVSGQGGHSQALKVAIKVGPGFDLAESETLDLLRSDYNPRCVPPWSDADLQRKVAEAYKVEPRRGWLKDAGRGDGGGGPGAAATGPEDAPAERPDDPHRLARLFLGRRCSHADGRTLHYWGEEWHRWDGRCWHVVGDREVHSEVVGAIKAEFDAIGRARGKPAEPVTTKAAANVLQALRHLALLPQREVPRQPAWIGVDGPRPKECLAVANGILHLPAFAAGEPDHVFEPTPRFFSPNNLGYEFRRAVPRPDAWLRFLDDILPGDPEAVGCLQEWFGYLLTPDTGQQKILMIIGPKRSGKGTLGRVLRALVGPDNVAAPTLSGLATPFGLQPLIGKTVGLIADARLSGRADGQVIVERLLSISGEDAQTIDRKHLTSWTGSLPTRFVVISNELPRMGDASGALPGRMILVALTQSFFGREDAALTDRLLAELPAILLWSIAGWGRLRARGRFVQPASGRELMAELDDLSSPIGSFVAECCKVDPAASVAVGDLFKAWKAWCEEEGKQHCTDSAGMGKQLRAVLPHLKTTQARVGGKVVRTYRGIELLPKEAF